MKNIITFILIIMVVPLVMTAQDNTFNGTTDSNWDVASNWSTGLVPTSPITGLITIAANCTNANGVNYTFQSGSTLKINTGITFTNNGTGTWTMQGTVINEGTYTQAELTNEGTHKGTGTFVGNLTLNGTLEPGYTPAPFVNCGDLLVYDGQSYATLQIGTQCWMAENLNVGTMVNGSTNQTNNSTIEKYCYGDDVANCTTFGGLYQWNEMMQYVTTESTQGVCPTGWYLPSDSEWTTLTDALGGTGTNTGSKMAGNAALWNSGVLVNDPEFGTSGLAVLPAGSRNTNGSFGSLGDGTGFPSSTENGSNAWVWNMNKNFTDVLRSNLSKDFGFSVRCVQGTPPPSVPTITIGTQTWMANNLDVGTMIPGSTDMTNNSILEKYCYDDDPANCAIYGALYQWDEMMQYVTTAGTQGVCPTGFHLPTDDEWTTLTDALGGMGTNTGSKMAGNAALWNSGVLVNDPEFGTSGLTVLPAGSRNTNGSFGSLGDGAGFSSSTENGSNAWVWNMNISFTDVLRSNLSKDFGYSVRCVQD